MVGGRETRVDAVMDHILLRGPLSNPEETPEAAEFRGVTAAQAGCIKRTIGTRESWRWSKVVNIGRSHPSTPHLSSTLLLPPTRPTLNPKALSSIESNCLNRAFERKKTCVEIRKDKWES